MRITDSVDSIKFDALTIQDPINPQPVVKISGPINILPKELLSDIFSYLTPPELAKTCFLINKEWKHIASEKHLWNGYDLKKLFPTVHILDGKVWKTHCDLSKLGISVDDEPALDNFRDIPKLTCFMRDLKGKVEGNVEATVLTIPCGLTLKKFIEFASAPLIGNKIIFKDSLNGSVIKYFGDLSVDKTYKVNITNTVLDFLQKSKF